MGRQTGKGDFTGPSLGRGYNKQISPRFPCNRSGLHYYGTKKLQKKSLCELEELDWQFDMIGMYTFSQFLRLNESKKEE